MQHDGGTDMDSVCYVGMDVDKEKIILARVKADHDQTSSFLAGLDSQFRPASWATACKIYARRENDDGGKRGRGSGGERLTVCGYVDKGG